jgi:predicted negative regulator of RcsB-dependent stress response
VALYERTEEEQIEGIKKWWKENGTSVVTGFLIGISLLAGWRWWQFYTEQQAQTASMMYERVISFLQQGEPKQASEVANALLKDYSNSPYAVLVALNLAEQDVKKGDVDSSQARLQWVIAENGILPPLTHVARLRKARLLLSQGKVAEAKQLIASVTDKTGFQASYAELQGDIAVIEGQIDVARTAYQEAVDQKELSTQHHVWVQMKLDNLGRKAEERIESVIPLSAMGNVSTLATENVLTMSPSSIFTIPPQNSAVPKNDKVSTSDGNPAATVELKPTGQPTTVEVKASEVKLNSDKSSVTPSPATVEVKASADKPLVTPIEEKLSPDNQAVVSSTSPVTVKPVEEKSSVADQAAMPSSPSATVELQPNTANQSVTSSATQSK